MGALSIKQVRKTYGPVEILKGINIDIEAGEFLILVGPSGCGKSTLLKMVAGLLEPTDGRLHLWRKPVAQLDESGKKMAFVFQSPTLMPWASVQTNVRLPLDLAGMPREEADARVTEALALVGLSKFAKALPRLDADLLELWRKKKLTVIFVTHSIHEAVFLSSRVVMMAARPGRVVEQFQIDEPYPRSADFMAAGQPAARQQHRRGARAMKKNIPLMSQPRVQRVLYPVLIGVVLVALWQWMVVAME
eukprot:gene38769-50949_t